MMPFPFFLALKYLKPKRSVLSVVTLISTIGVLLGVAILVIVLSVMTGFDNMWRDKILSFNPHITVSTIYGVLNDEEDVCKKIEAIKGVKGVAPVIQTIALMQSDDHVSAPYVIGIDAQRAASVSMIPSNIVDGTFQLSDSGIVMGVDEAAGHRISVGSKVLLYSEKNMNGLVHDELYLPDELKVSGLFRMGMDKFDHGVVLISLESARNLVDMDEGVHAVYVMLDDPYKFQEYTKKIEDVLGGNYIIRNWSDIDRVLFSALRTEKNMMFILLVFITIVAIFCVTNTLIVITVQKTDEIGLLKALGFPGWKIMAAFVLHAWVQCIVGMLSGTVIGLLILNNMENIVRLLAKIHISVFSKEIYGFDAIPWSTSFGDIAFICFFVMVFCTLSSIIPAYRAAKMDPVEALRKE